MKKKYVPSPEQLAQYREKDRLYRIAKKLKDPEWWARRKAANLARAKARYHSDPEVRARVTAYGRAYFQKLKGTEKYRLIREKFNAEKRAKRKRGEPKTPLKTRLRQNAAAKKRREADLGFKLRTVLLNRMRTAIKEGYESSSMPDILGCSIAELKRHLESLWEMGMSWKNYRHDGWHIDHIKPCSSFDLTDPAQQRICFHYTNLRPLWGSYNMSKGAREQPSPDIHDPNDVI